jgi:hypothetical protein
MRWILVLLTVAFAVPAAAAAPDEPHYWVKPSIGLAYNHLGLLGTVQAEARTPMARTDSIVLQNTHAGIGGRFRVSPAFIEIGPQFKLAPLDVFDVTFNAGLVGMWRNSAGLLVYNDFGSTLETTRNDKHDNGESIEGGFLFASAAPVFKIKLGPVIAFTKAEFSFFHLLDQDEYPGEYWYEATRDILLRPNDIMVESTTGVLAEILDAGENTTVNLRAGALLRHRESFISRDISTAVGGVVTVKPGRKQGWPTILLAVLGYVRDPDRALGAPNIQISVSWEFQKPYRQQQAEEANDAASEAADGQS